MAKTIPAIAKEPDSACLLDPDCVKCLRKKINAVGVVVFFKEGDAWRIGNFQGEVPQTAAEVDFECMLAGGVPDIIADREDGLLISDDDGIHSFFPKLSSLFQSKSIVAAAVAFEDLRGVRLAWRDARTPFSLQDLKTIRCFGQCPPGCN
jgi:hypothetical protein